MAKEVIVNTTCDNHDETTRVAAETREVGADGKWFTLDLCDPCDKTLLEPLRRLLAEHGVAVSRSSSTPPSPRRQRGGRATDKTANKPCLWCPSMFATNSGLLHHLESAHRLPKSMTAVFGDRCPLDGAHYDGLGMHIGVKHDCSVAEAFAQARSAGDLYGVVREVMARAAATIE